ncbi:conserved protein of unknown function [Pseudomonas marincola]|uniref:Uncharacterized protein n=1 Tax=Pseudomonas marincola TaxID=437900 RepID=A0A653E837_9PSED|nr:hypothetical protein [Pseudomonas marincola]CAE6905849.1 conserved protein of unknown function [Pseudomonas marincola]
MTAPTITDDLVAELEALAKSATPQDLDNAEEIIKADPGAMIDCPVCGGEGYASLENDYCNFDNHAIGVQFYGIGSEFGAGERYFRAANPATILALLAERAELKRDVGRYRWLKDNAKSEFFGDQLIDMFTCSGQKIDRLVDAAMQEQTP